LGNGENFLFIKILVFGLHFGDDFYFQRSLDFIYSQIEILKPDFSFVLEAIVYDSSKAYSNIKDILYLLVFTIKISEGFQF